MVFYEIKKELREIQPADINPDYLTVGCVSCEELATHGKEWDFDEETITASQKANPLFRTGVDVHEKYTFSELRIVNRDGHEDYVSVFIKKNFLLIVDIMDEDGSTINSFMSALRKYPCDRISEEKLILWFIESLLSDGRMISEKLRNCLTEMEESIVNGQAGETFNIELLDLKKKILKYYDYYGQMLDIVETLEENDNEILNEDKLIYISNLSNRISRLSDDMNTLISISDHLQDAYATLLDQRMNNTMKVFTIITTIFFPLTIIVGWYGMNFTHMPELTWEYGYIYVIILSVLIVAILGIIGKKKKWF